MPILENVSLLNVIEIQAEMITKENLGNYSLQQIDQNRSKLIYSRDLLPAEYGCAISHNMARRTIDTHGKGGIVLEDDARVLDGDYLAEIASRFLKKYSNQAAVLSFFAGHPHCMGIPHRESKGREWMKLSGSPISSVAYVVTSLGAQLLVAANEPVSYVADWPPSDIAFFICTKPLIVHDDLDTPSTINPDGNLIRSHPSKSIRLQILSFIYYVKMRHEFRGFRDYLDTMWLPRFHWQFDKMRYHFLKMRLK